MAAPSSGSPNPDNSAEMATSRICLVNNIFSLLVGLLCTIRQSHKDFWATAHYFELVYIQVACCEEKVVENTWKVWNTFGIFSSDNKNMQGILYWLLLSISCNFTKKCILQKRTNQWEYYIQTVWPAVWLLNPYLQKLSFWVETEDSDLEIYFSFDRFIHKKILAQ